MNPIELPLFPLKTVLFPTGLLPLRIFEPRYLDMVSHCMKNQAGFGVVLIAKGGEVGPVSTYSVGTVANITDWFQGSDGLLGLHVLGVQRFNIQSIHVTESGLQIGQVTLVEPELASEVAPRYKYMAQMLEGIIGNLPEEGLFQEPKLADANWVVARLAEILPLSLEDRQECLELANADQRLRYLEPYFSALRDRSGA